MRPRYAATSEPCPPSRARACSTLGVAGDVRWWTTRPPCPMSTENAATASSQPSAAGRISRTASPAGAADQGQVRLGRVPAGQRGRHRGRGGRPGAGGRGAATTSDEHRQQRQRLGDGSAAGTPRSSRAGSARPASAARDRSRRPCAGRKPMPKTDPGHGRGPPAGAGQLAGERADGEEHGRAGHQGDREVQATGRAVKPTDGGPAGRARPDGGQHEQRDQPERRGRPAPGRRRAGGWSARPAAARSARRPPRRA